ncbi:hypothetical protein [Novosphingobium ginsenosidimutans]|uniref:Uncharacterized protein n=1 Tax=Novosphingobium ginsenosidimutans TaxID=1176536 RepID=A0A5B8S080_9SPHN|nr:hypothetical protein [Novosphingobium ginsenosidimutans]QEA15006.1 hypothetical protein FRF71_02010 [Novosphingobium ginsenosidimutans]
MDRALIISVVMFGAGVFFTWSAVGGWRNLKHDNISILEAGILKVTGAEPLPVTGFDRWLQRFQLVMMSLFGPVMIFIGGFGFLSELGVL